MQYLPGSRLRSAIALTPLRFVSLDDFDEQLHPKEAEWTLV
jgi:hypothetical protein